jgi:hypothetical protein
MMPLEKISKKRLRKLIQKKQFLKNANWFIKLNYRTEYFMNHKNLLQKEIILTFAARF